MGKKEKIRFILIILVVLIIVGLKIVAMVWEKQQKPQVVEKAQQTPTCSIKYCEFPDGLIMRTEGTVSSKTPFKVFIRNLPQGVEKAYIQFSMESMDLGFNRFKLFPSENNPQEWRTNALLLPVCTIDDDRYDMDICLNDCNKAYRVRFRAR
ncbi:MAG: hypothetical protein IKI11_06975 [Neisseriaceae bacterium]|nr:hypothetical protein [Neisseriaceae bacterium]